MVCYHPRKAYRSKTINSNGKREIVFNRKDAFIDRQVILPCGQCIGCRLEKSRQWAIRCVHEASLHQYNSFITLTYNNQNLPVDGSLNKRHFQLFIKRLRKKFPGKLRYYHCGEYGEINTRPHYHACIFGLDFEDKVFFKYQNKLPIYRSATLEQCWTLGYSTVGSVTFESAAYVARYIMKKVTGEQATDHYRRPYEHVDPITGEVHNIVFDLQPEYTTMSRRPGIASGWFEEFKDDVFPHDEVIMRGKQFRPPRYYDQQHELTSPENHRKVIRKRKPKASLNREDKTPKRLKTRERVQEERLSRLPRKME